jgi:hopanoid biosynthesis associated RND transporter like protein HpnN
MLSALIGAIVGFCCRNARWVALATVLLGIVAGTYATRNFAMNSNSESLISPYVPWRVRQTGFDRAFPQRNNLILVVVDGATPERAEQAAAKLTKKLSSMGRFFWSVRRPDGGPFFNREGLLFMPIPQLTANLNQLIAAQPFLGGLAADPSLRGVLTSLSTALMGVEHGQARLESLAGPMKTFAETFDTVLAGHPKFLSWRALVTGSKPSPLELRRFIAVQPRLDYGSLTPGSHAARAIRRGAASLHLVANNGVRVRLTGPVQLSDEEFATLADRAMLIMSAMFLAILVMLWFAVQSIRMITCILVTLFAGLAMTAATGLALVGAFNIISVAFIVLFVGLGVDFGIQFCVRYRGERHAYGELGTAIINAGRGIGAPLALAAAATAAGFFSFLPTDYLGIAELGLIAGFGMIIAFILNITMLPALLKLAGPKREAAEVGFKLLVPIDHALERGRRVILWVIFGIVLAALAAVPFLHFDFNPLNLRSPRSESVSTLLDLMSNPDTSPNTIDVLVHSQADAHAMSAKLSGLPEAGRVVMLDNFIPADQKQKLALIHDAAGLLDLTLNPFVTRPPPTDGELKQVLLTTSAELRKVASKAGKSAGAAAQHLANSLERLAHAAPGVRTRATAALVPDMKIMLDQIRDALKAQPVTRSSLPADLVRDWVAPDGTERIEVAPRSTAQDNETLTRFSAAVLRVAPNSTGTPIAIQESGRTIVRAFAQAGFWSVLAIMLLLAIALRHPRDVLISLAALMLTGLATLGTCVVIGLQLNYANIIALPLLLGIGVAFSIYVVAAWRAGVQHFLQTTLARAVLFSALTTGCSFGSLWLSTHPGTASMGELLVISLGWTLVTVLLFLPALLGPPRDEPETNPVLAGHLRVR